MRDLFPLYVSHLDRIFPKKRTCYTCQIDLGYLIVHNGTNTRQALYAGARRAVAAIEQCQPYTLSVPIQVKKEYLVFDNPSEPGRRITKEGVLPSRKF